MSRSTSREDSEEIARIIKNWGFPQPVVEYRFHPVRRWRFDYAWPDFNVAVEKQGSIFTRGRHTRGKGYESDCEKLNEAQLMGWELFYVPSHWFTDGRLYELLERIFHEHFQVARPTRPYGKPKPSRR